MHDDAAPSGSYGRSIIVRMRIRVVTSLLTLLAVAATFPGVSSSAASTSFKRCAPVKVQLGIGVATVSQRNTSCVFARDFVRRNPDQGICDSGTTTVRGWRKTYTNVGESSTLTLRKGAKAIRTNACST